MHPLLHNRAFRIAAGLALALLLILLVTILVLTWGKGLDERHRPLAFDESFDFDSGTFADYLAWSERRLRAAHPEVTDEVIANLGPFRLEPFRLEPSGRRTPQACPPSQTHAHRNGIVLTHDVQDSAYTMRALGSYFQERCFLVYGLLLPGHGTRPGDLLTADWEDWVAAEAFAVRELAREAENLYLAGHGAGGTLAIHEAAGNAAIDGLVLFGPTLDTRLNPRKVAETALGWLVPATRWDEVLPAHSLYRYESTTYSLVDDRNALVQATHAALPTRPFEVPVFMVVSQQDATAGIEATLAYMQERNHPLSQLVLFNRETPAVQPGRIVMNSYHPDVGLLSLSHKGLMVPMEDPEFGFYGASRDCGHYYRKDPDAYERCMAGERTVQGEINPDNLAEGLLERVEFNPFYYDMLRVLDRFIAPVTPVPNIQTR
jgi:alpha-beta hydrolase superfamily lysophospholipase